ncbi:hypothetical protein GGS20DRAFT_45855 [Poronia punctata]|nr:hypothetical protein GGS20DRAFT_45855 [Poronia punctata]
MQLPRSVVPSQRYSPASDYAYENHVHEGVPVARQPLGESTGNIQPHNLTAALWCNQLSLSPHIHPIPTPILPSQALTSSYGTSLRGERSLHRNVSLHELPMGSQGGRKNPIYHHKNFADYRNKVMQKELDKEHTVWPDWLEDAFLDALLLIPQLGRKKFSSKTVLYGRNMLISEYLWIYHWTLHPPKKGELIPSGKQREKTRSNPHGHPMFRSRKQVSSHIQVLKGFFPTLSTFHFIFPRQKDGLDEDKRMAREEEDTESFKHNRVLISIADGRLPDERPNYEYFSRLLNAENDVFIRPKQCWIFVSSSKTSMKEKTTTLADGTTKKQVTAHHPDGLTLTETDYPHLKLNGGKDYKDLPRQGNNPTVLLHEYTRCLAQRESSSVKEISSKWDARFPDLGEKLTAALDATQPGDELTSRCVVGPCDTFHFETVLDLHATSKFPPGSDLNGLVEFTICRPDLHGHSWRSKTCVIKPDELYMADTENENWDQNSSIDVIPAHRVSCAGTGRCDCTSRGSRDTISIPFPASSWANTFIKLAPYVTAERERKERERATREAGSMNGRAEREAARAKKENEASSTNPKPKEACPKDLLSQVAMYQEIWSAPPSEATDKISKTEEAAPRRTRASWTRRAVILWTFVPVHEKADDRGKTTSISPGTNWRFLTKVDPTSSYHQQQAYISGSASKPIISRDHVMSPNPPFVHHINAAMQENFSAATYDPNSTTAYGLLHTHPGQQQKQRHQFHQHQHDPQTAGGLNPALEVYPHGLETPPRTGYHHNSPDGNSIKIEPSHTLHHHISFMSDGSAGTDQSLLGPEQHADPSFLDVVPGYTFPDLTAATTARYNMDTGTSGWVDTGNSNQWAAIAAAAVGHHAHSQPTDHEDISSSGTVEHHHPHHHHDNTTTTTTTNNPWGSWPTTVSGPGEYNTRETCNNNNLWDEGTSFDTMPPHHDGQNNHNNNNYVLNNNTQQSQSPPSPLLQVLGRKRSRTETDTEIGEGYDNDDQNQPARKISRTNQPGSGSSPLSSSSSSAAAAAHEFVSGGGVYV